MAWEEVQDIRPEPLRGSDLSAFLPNVVVYAYLAGGRRKLLMHLNDKAYDIDHEIAVMRAAGAELRGTGSVPDAPVA